MSNDLSGVWDGSYIQPSTGMVTFTQLWSKPAARSPEA